MLSAAGGPGKGTLSHWFGSSLLISRITANINGENLLSKMTDTNSVREPTCLFSVVKEHPRFTTEFPVSRQEALSWHAVSYLYVRATRVKDERPY